MKPNVNQATFHIIFVGAQAPVFSRTYIGQTKFQSGNYLGPLKRTAPGDIFFRQKLPVEWLFR